MKTLIILTVTNEALELLSDARKELVSFIGRMNLEDDDTAPENALCYSSKLSSGVKESINKILSNIYDDGICALFLELENDKSTSTDPYTFTIK